MLDTLLDRSVVFSFDRTGFQRHARRFDPLDLAKRLDDRLILVTGASAGLGRATALALAGLGAEVGLLVRDAGRGEAARQTILEAHPGARAFVETIDLASRASILRFAERWRERRVDVLIHNAGVLPANRVLTEDGLESTWGTNVVGPQLLSVLLRAALCASPDPRTIWVSSGGMYTQRLSLEDLDWARRRFDGVVAYAQSKRAEVILAERWAELEPRIWQASMHPGWADTPGVQGSLPLFRAITRAILRTPEMGADTSVWLSARATRPGPSGRFWFDRREAPVHMRASTHETAADRDALWALVCRQAGVRDDAAGLFTGESSR